MSKIPPAAGCSSQKLIVYSQSSQVYNTMPKIRSHKYVKIRLNKHHLKHHWGSNCEKISISWGSDLKNISITWASDLKTVMLIKKNVLNVVIESESE